MKDRQTELFLYTHFRNRIWTSGCKIGSKWVWGDGTEFGYTNWGRQQPDNSGGNERFLEIDPELQAGIWNDLYEEKKLCTVCEY